VLRSGESVSIERPALRRLAARLGIADSYHDQSGGEERVTTAATRMRLLAAMGFDASTEEHALRAMRTLRRRVQRQGIAPVRVVQQRSRGVRRVRVRIPTLHVHEVRWTLTLRLEDGIAHAWHGAVHGGPARSVELELPMVPPLGYHDLTIELDAEGERREVGEVARTPVPVAAHRVEVRRDPEPPRAAQPRARRSTPSRHD
jgi:4-alpha-glucanotransferase